MALISVVKSQAEALEGDVSYDYCMITTKCLPDVLPTPKLVEEVIASKKVKAWSLIQVRSSLVCRPAAYRRTASASRRTCTKRSSTSTRPSYQVALGSESWLAKMAKKSRGAEG